VLDSLRFGPIDVAASFSSPQKDGDLKVASTEVARNRRILDGVIRGIGSYGNSFGVATVGGEIQFEPCYSGNPLVNALALGIARKDELFFARARGEGNPVIYVGSKTGRDGIHGASLLASAEFTEESQQKRPNVQVGDPFLEKLLLEACLEVMKSGAVVAIQDMGAAGLTCSTVEMASRGETGIEIELNKVPQRETGMTPYEIMLSESQERMLLVAERGREEQVFEIFRKWGLDAVEIGRVTGDGMLRVRHHGNVVAEIAAHPLAEEGPVYQRPIAAPAARENEKFVEFAPASSDLTKKFQRLLASPAIASKHWVTDQYDSMVRTNTLVGPGAGDAAVVRIKGTPRALALATDCNSRWCWLDPQLGAMHAVAEAARNVACTGARPIAATNCLNFGNPEKPEVMWQFSAAIDGVAEACRTLNTPITGGNVSFYNETLGKSIYPTPTVGILGVLEDSSRAVSMAFKTDGDVILLVRGLGRGEHVANADEIAKEFSSSEYAKTIHGIVGGAPPALDLEAEKNLIEFLVTAAGAGMLRSAHDVSDGGIAVTLAECCFASKGLSANIELGASALPAEAALFGESASQVVISMDPTQVGALDLLAAQYSVETREIGRVTGGGDFRIEVNGAAGVSAPMESLHDVWANSLQRALGL
ncbi:MAG: phosphoribosylformylglycinamidine synthase subunit PurL, partial [Acidobacteria bacterium]|nr:phosphoribosylformylglycinamidine synthase subunit PurL [Acidobacteriota bacterium]